MKIFLYLPVSVQSLSHVWLFVTPWMPGIPVLHRLLKIVQIHVHWVGDAIWPSHPLSSPSPPAFNLSQHQGLFHWVSSLHQVGSSSVSISPFNEYSGLISFRIGWFDLLAVQGTLKSLLQHHSSKALILQPEAIFYGPTPQSVHDYWKDHNFNYRNQDPNYPSGSLTVKVNEV